MPKRTCQINPPVCAANPETIAEAGRRIRAGELVVFPTETVYGLGANAFDDAAVRRIFVAKNRPASSPLIVHVDSIVMARSLVTEWPDMAERLALRFWPGPLTLVLPKQASIPDSVTAGLGTVGIRIPGHPVALALIRAAGVPIAAPSANRFTELSPTEARHVPELVNEHVALILDDGPAAVGIESTVLSLVEAMPLLLRPGMISQRQIEEVIGPVEVLSSATAVYASPGLHPKHYCPRTRLVLLQEDEALPQGRGVYLWISQDMPATRDVRMPSDADAYAASLYRTLHELDGQGWDWIAVERPPATPAWAGIRDRLERAAFRAGERT